jgi:hypothetical protein
MPARFERFPKAKLQRSLRGVRTELEHWQRQYSVFPDRQDAKRLEAVSEALKAVALAEAELGRITT